MLKSKGYEYEAVSVDRVDTDRICKPYLTLKNAIYEERLQLYATKLLKEELIGLERNNNGRIDHGPSGINSKDVADALCGAIYNASKHAEQFAFEYGEDLQLTIDSSSSLTAQQEQKQITVDFENELKKVLDPMQPRLEKLKKDSEEHYMDFGMGKSVPYMSAMYLANGIIL